MADAAAARREARRRKILENSSNRLQLIAGKSDEDDSKDSLNKRAASGESLISDETASKLSQFNNGVIVTEPEPRILTSLSSQDLVETCVQTGDNQNLHDFSRCTSHSQPTEKPTVWEKEPRIWTAPSRQDLVETGVQTGDNQNLNDFWHCASTSEPTEKPTDWEKEPHILTALSSQEFVQTGDNQNLCDLRITSSSEPAEKPTTWEKEPLLSTALSSQDYVETADNQNLYDFAHFTSPSETTEKPTIWEKFITSKYDVILLSSLIQIVYSFSILTFESTYFFLPLIVYTVTKLIWTKPQNNNFANAILLLTGIPANRAHRIMKAVCFFGTISQDISLYLFTTICVQALCIFLADNLLTT